jgi:hypothetical protein
MGFATRIGDHFSLVPESSMQPWDGKTGNRQSTAPDDIRVEQLLGI